MKAEGVLAFCAPARFFSLSVSDPVRLFVLSVLFGPGFVSQSVTSTLLEGSTCAHTTTLYSLLSRTCARPTEGVTTRASPSARSARCGSKPIQSTVVVIYTRAGRHKTTQFANPGVCTPIYTRVRSALEIVSSYI